MVSIVIPTHNRDKWLRHAVDSVRRQTFTDWELFLIDDGSTDDTKAWASSPTDRRIRYIECAHRGVSAARNLGIRLSERPWIAFLDSDDEWKPDKLAAQFDAIRRETGRFRICYTDEIWIRRGRRVNPREKHRKVSGWMYRPSLRLCLISPSSVLLHRSILDECGEFDERYPVCEDYELWLRVTSRFPVLFVPKPLIVKHGGHADQLSVSRWGLDRYRVRAMLARLRSGTLSYQQTIWTRQEIRRKALVLAKGYANRDKLGPARAYRHLAEACDPGETRLWTGLAPRG